MLALHESLGRPHWPPMAFALFVLALAWAVTPAAAQTPAPPPPFSISRTEGAQGKNYTVVIRSAKCEPKLTEAQLVAPSGVTITDLKNKGANLCFVTAIITVDKDAPLGDDSFTILSKEGDQLGVVPFKIISIPPGPIPPDLDKPQVDVMWAVVPQGIVKDNFGKRIGKNFYCIEIVIGNSTGYDLQIASAGFRFPVPRDGSGRENERLAFKGVVPVNSYRVARGTLETGQQLDPRNLSLNLLKAFGPVLTGLTPFFNSPGSDFPEAINVLSNPLEKGLELVFPDKSFRHLERLDEQILRDGVIVKNNQQLRTRAFIAKDLLKDYGVLAPADKDKPMKVMMALGELLIIGDKIEYKNRVVVSSSVESGAVLPPPLINVGNLPKATQGDEEATQKILFPGRYLDNAVPTLTRQVEGIKIVRSQVIANGGILEVFLKVASTVPPGTYDLKISTIGAAGGGVATASFEVEAAPPEVKEDTGITSYEIGGEVAKPFSDKETMQEVIVVIEGKHLHDATVKSADGWAIPAEDVEVNDEGTQIAAVVEVPAKTAAKKYKLNISNNAAANNTVPVNFEVKKLPAPTVDSAAPAGETQPLSGVDKRTVSFVVTGKNLDGAKLEKESGGPDFKFGNSAAVSDNGRKAVFQVEVPANTPAKPYKFTLKNAGGTQAAAPVNFVVKQSPPEITNPVLTQSKPVAADAAADSEEVSVVIAGRNFLQTVQLQPVGEALIILGKTVNPEGTQLTVRLKVKAGTPADTYRIKVSNPGTDAADAKEVTFKVPQP